MILFFSKNIIFFLFYFFFLSKSNKSSLPIKTMLLALLCSTSSIELRSVAMECTLTCSPRCSERRWAKKQQSRIQEWRLQTSQWTGSLKELSRFSFISPVFCCYNCDDFLKYINYIEFVLKILFLKFISNWFKAKFLGPFFGNDVKLGVIEVGAMADIILLDYAPPTPLNAR